MVEIKELQDGVEVVAGSYRERFNNRFKAIMAAHALAFGESQAQDGRRIEIQVPSSWGEPYVVGHRS